MNIKDKDKGTLCIFFFIFKEEVDIIRKHQKSTVNGTVKAAEVCPYTKLWIIKMFGYKIQFFNAIKYALNVCRAEKRTFFFICK